MSAENQVEKNNEDHRLIFNQLSIIMTKIDALKEDYDEEKKERKELKKIVVGNGAPGLQGRIQDLEKDRSFSKSIMFCIGAIFLALIPVVAGELGHLIFSILK